MLNGGWWEVAKRKTAELEDTADPTVSRASQHWDWLVLSHSLIFISQKQVIAGGACTEVLFPGMAGDVFVIALWISMKPPLHSVCVCQQQHLHDADGNLHLSFVIWSSFELWSRKRHKWTTWQGLQWVHLRTCMTCWSDLLTTILNHANV